MLVEVVPDQGNNLAATSSFGGNQNKEIMRKLTVLAAAFAAGVTTFAARAEDSAVHCERIAARGHEGGVSERKPARPRR